jgi:hypothetical protein
MNVAQYRRALARIKAARPQRSASIPTDPADMAAALDWI